jgi:hypothetical protein
VRVPLCPPAKPTKATENVTHGMIENTTQQSPCERLCGNCSSLFRLLSLLPVLRIRDVYPGLEFFHFGSKVKKIPDPGSRIRIHIKEFKYFKTHKIVSKLSEI